MAKIRTIPATKNLFSNTPIAEIKKRRVAGYARVSTDSDEQFTSYEAQIDYYTNYIKSRSDWEFVSVYTDEGITGTSTKHRKGFQTMIADALDGKIDLIVTKSVSRFARNTVDSLTTIRQLKENNVEVYFEKENIWTFDSKGELLITIMSSLAQEESRSISENVTWGQRKKIADGKVTLAYSTFLGYDRGENGQLVINPKQAEVVKHIYRLFLEGKSTFGIAQQLMDEKIPSPAGKSKWAHSTIISILTNEKYKGDALLQKYYTTDFLTKKMKKNEGEVQQYYVENDHEAIIDPEIFDYVQVEIERRKDQGQKRRSHIFCNKIICGSCGGSFTRVSWHCGTPNEKKVWLCKDKYKKKLHCSTQHLYEDQLESLFVTALNKLLKNKETVIKDAEEMIDVLCDTSELLPQQSSLSSEIDEILALLDSGLKENAQRAMDQDEYNNKREALTARYNETKEKLDGVTAKINDLNSRRIELKTFLSKFSEQPDVITQFSKDAWIMLLDHVTVNGKESITFTFKNGQDIQLPLKKWKSLKQSSK